MLVAPYVGAWIETAAAYNNNVKRSTVAPYVGAWIETNLPTTLSSKTLSRTLRGCVD